MQVKPITHPAAWRVSDIPSKDDIAVDIVARHMDAFAGALKKVRSQRLNLEHLTREHFPLDAIAEDVAAWRRELRDGRGLFLLRGLPVSEFSVADWEIILLGLGLHLGQPVSQSNLGDLVGHVINVGGDDRRERSYRNSRELSLHTDRCDYIGMLCLNKAKSGGLSGYCSALAVHNEMLATRPELLAPLYQGYRLHRFGEQAPGESPITETPVPVFSFAGGVPNVIYIRGYIDLAVDEGYYTLSELEHEALETFDKLTTNDEFCLNMMLEPGEANFTNNCLLLHRRTAFEDDAESDRRRHLLRLWLTDPERPCSNAAKAHKTSRGIVKRDGAGTYYAGPGYTRSGDEHVY